MAFILGLFYAGVYVKSGNIWAAAFLHGLVDFLWITFFGG
jgi:membrane protease YdiL (CAAX protease family)